MDFTPINEETTQEVASSAVTSVRLWAPSNLSTRRHWLSFGGEQEQSPFVGTPSLPESDQMASPEGQVLDHLSLSSVAHNLHYRYEQGGLDGASAKDYATRLLKMLGYPQDDITVLAALQTWQQLYPQDQVSSPQATIPEATTPTESWGYGTSSKARAVPDADPLEDEERDSTVPSEVNDPDDNWPEFGERPYDEKHHYDVQFSDHSVGH